MKKTHGCYVSLKKDILDVALASKPEPIKKNFVLRILAFTLSGTYIVDLKDTSIQGRVSSKIQPDFLSNFFVNLIKQSSQK
jgi:hypothetical protein